jgi:hypothetical protein
MSNSMSNSITLLETTSNGVTRFAIAIDGKVAVIAPSTRPGFTRSAVVGSPAFLLGNSDKQVSKANRRVGSGSWIAGAGRAAKLTTTGRLTKAATTALWAGEALPKTDADAMAATRTEIREAQIAAAKEAKSAKSAKSATRKTTSKKTPAKAATDDRLAVALESLAAGQRAIAALLAIAMGGEEVAAAAK